MSLMPEWQDRAPDVKLTYDDYVLFPEDGLRHELIDGEHYVTPSPNLRHQDIIGRLYLIIGNWLQGHPVGRVYFAPLDVLFSQYDVVEPDLLFVSNERSGVLAEKFIQGAPDLAVEVVSASTRHRDDTIKLRLYERFGVREYWTVDPVAESMAVYRRVNDRFVRPIILTRAAADVFRTDVLPGLDVPLARVFE